MIMNYYDRSDWVEFVMKIKEDNDVTNCTCVVYIENDTKLSWLIGSGVVCDEN